MRKYEGYGWGDPADPGQAEVWQADGLFVSYEPDRGGYVRIYGKEEKVGGPTFRVGHTTSFQQHLEDQVADARHKNMPRTKSPIGSQFD